LATASPVSAGRPIETGYDADMPGWISPWELLILLVVVLLVFGPKRLPEMGRSLGKGMREFKNSISGGGDDDRPEKAELPVGTQDTTAPAPPRERDKTTPV
jgi:sec-independent protein translocase protein TatA